MRKAAMAVGVTLFVLAGNASARFLSVDPVTADNNTGTNFNRYWYANNNPYKFTDPDGRDAIITHLTNGRVLIEIPITFSGPAANPETISRMNADISSAWSGTYDIDGSEISVTVVVTEGSLNNITLTDGPTSLESHQGASFVRGGNSGEWNARAGNAPHEAGHLMGAKDKYTEGPRDQNGNRTTTTDPSFRNNLMGDGAGKPDGRNVKEILNSERNWTRVKPNE